MKECECDCWYIAQQYENLYDNAHENHMHLSRIFIAMKKILKDRYLSEGCFNTLMKDAFEIAKEDK